MPRTTRAAAKAQHADLVFDFEISPAAEPDADPATIELPATPKTEREPLRSITPNSMDGGEVEKPMDDDVAGKNTKAKGKKRAKGKASKKPKATDVASLLEEDTAETNGKDDDDGNGADGSVDAVALPQPVQGEQPRNDKVEVSEAITIERPASPTVKKERLTRSQRAKAGMEAEALVQDQSHEASAVDTACRPQTSAHHKMLVADALAMNDSAPASNIAAGVEDHSLPTLNNVELPKANALVSSDDSSQRKMSSGATSLMSPQLPTPQLQDPIDAIDALEDAIEAVGNILPKLDDPVSPEKPKVNKTVASKTASAQRASLVLAGKTQGPTSKPTQTKTGLARSASVKATPNSLISSTQPSALARSASVRPATTPKVSTLNRAAAAAERRSKMASGKEAESKASKPAGTTTDYLASRRRPVSVQFPIPPPPPKSTKPPTQPTFTLPGEAIAAKRKAEREAKLKKEEEEAAKRRAFKARPLPGAGRPRPSSMIVKQTASSIARMSLAGPNGSSDKENVPKTASGLKRSGTVTGATTQSSKRDSLVAKRSSMIAAKPAPPTTTRPAPATTATQKRTNMALNFGSGKDAPRPSSIFIPKNSPPITSTQSSAVSRATSVSKSRNPSASSSTILAATKSIVTPEDAAVQRQKAREIFNRDRVEKESREKERREKEESAKRARLEAAERGRQASREWAEKQKRKLLEAKNQMLGRKTSTPA